MSMLLHVISSLRLGGAEQCLLTLVQELGKAGVQQQIIYFHDGPVRQQLEALALRTHHIKPLLMARFIKRVAALKPDVIHSSLWAATISSVIAGRLLKIPVIGSLHAPKEHEGALRNYVDKAVLPYAHALIAVSTHVAQSTAKLNNRLSNKLVTIPNGINRAALIRQAERSGVTREQLHLSPDDFIVGAVGRFVPVKNYPLLLDALAPLMALHSSIMLVLVGTGPAYTELKVQAEKLGISNRIRFVVDQPAAGYYSLFDVFVLCSLHEGFSLALVEALSFGVPCIATAPQDTHHIIIHNSTGLVCKPTQEALTEAVQYLYNTPLLRQKLAHAGRALSARYCHERMAQDYLALFKKHGL